MKKIISIISLLIFACAGLSAQNDVIMPDKPHNKKYVDFSNTESGVWAGVDVSVGPTLHVNKDYKTSLVTDVHALCGYRLNCYFMAGIGFGVKIYAPSNDRVDPKNPGNIVSLPLFADLRGVMMNPNGRTVVPCWSLDAGYAFFDGFTFSPALGIRVGSMERHHFLVRLAYVLQGAELVRNDGYQFSGYLHSLQLKLGYQF